MLHREVGCCACTQPFQRSPGRYWGFCAPSFRRKSIALSPREPALPPRRRVRGEPQPPSEPDSSLCSGERRVSLEATGLFEVTTVCVLATCLRVHPLVASLAIGPGLRRGLLRRLLLKCPGARDVDVCYSCSASTPSMLLENHARYGPYLHILDLRFGEIRVVKIGPALDSKRGDWTSPTIACLVIVSMLGVWSAPPPYPPPPLEARVSGTASATRKWLTHAAVLGAPLPPGLVDPRQRTLSTLSEVA